VFKHYIQKNFAHKEIIKLKQNDKIIAISIFHNGKLYDMSGEAISDVDNVWDILYEMGKSWRKRTINPSTEKNYLFVSFYFLLKRKRV